MLRTPSGTWRHQERLLSVQRLDSFVTVDCVQDEVGARRAGGARDQTFAGQLFEASRTWLVIAATGIVIGVIAAALNVITAWLASLRVGYCLGNFYLNETMCCKGMSECRWQAWLQMAVGRYAAYIATGLAFALAAVVLVQRLAPQAAGLGILEIKCIAGGFDLHGFLDAPVLVLKSVCLPLAIALGLSLGKEGPLVHYAVCVGHCVAALCIRHRAAAWRRREIYMAAAAAGVAVAFGLPMGGVLFAVEEILPLFQLRSVWKAYVCALIAVSTLAAMNPFRTGQVVLFKVAYDTLWHFFELPMYALLGVFGGVYGVAVLALNLQVAAFRKRHLARHAVAEVVVLALALAAVCYCNQFLREDMTQAMQTLFAECPGSEICDARARALVPLLLFATLVRLLLTVVTYGCKVPAGIFVPSMAAGATFGRAVGVFLDWLQRQHPDLPVFGLCPDGPCVIPGTYALIGAGAALSGITHLTVTVAVIMFELTGAVKYIIPTMVTVAVTKAINDRWGRGGIADQMITFNGLPYLDALEDVYLGVAVLEAMLRQTKVVTPAMATAHLRRLVQTLCRGFPLVESAAEPRILGYVLRLELEDALATVTEGTVSFTLLASDSDLLYIVQPTPLVVSVETSLDYVRELFVRLAPQAILVEDNDVLAGLLTRKDMVRYERTVHEMEHPRGEDVLADAAWLLFQRVKTAVQRR